MSAAHRAENRHGTRRFKSLMRHLMGNYRTVGTLIRATRRQEKKAQQRYRARKPAAGRVQRALYRAYRMEWDFDTRPFWGDDL